MIVWYSSLDAIAVSIAFLRTRGGGRVIALESRASLRHSNESQVYPEGNWCWNCTLLESGDFTVRNFITKRMFSVSFVLWKFIWNYENEPLKSMSDANCVMVLISLETFTLSRFGLKLFRKLFGAFNSGEISTVFRCRLRAGSRNMNQLPSRDVGHWLLSREQSRVVLCADQAILLWWE